MLDASGSRLFILFAGTFLVARVSCDDYLPVVINTWPFVDANKWAVESLKNGNSSLDAVEIGCSVCEIEQCDHSVGFGGSPDEEGQTTLDAMIMDGETHNVGAVGCLKEIKSAISVARSVMEHTKQTFLVGEDATAFAVQMGFQKANLQTNYSREIWENWMKNNCQPNFWNNETVTPDPSTSCGPYSPKSTRTDKMFQRPEVDRSNHDTIGMIVIDEQGRIACGTSTNGLTYKVVGRVGDSPIAGAGCYVDKDVGGAAATGDGDVMMRFLPTLIQISTKTPKSDWKVQRSILCSWTINLSTWYIKLSEETGWYQVVESMRAGSSPTDATRDALSRIAKYYPGFQGALIAVNINGQYGAANHGFNPFQYTVYNPQLDNSTVIPVS